MKEVKKAIIVGASSGIGREVARLLLSDGWHIGIAARRKEPLLELKATDPERVEVMAIDVNSPDAREQLLNLVQRLGGMDLYFHASGIGISDCAWFPLQETIMPQPNSSAEHSKR